MTTIAYKDGVMVCDGKACIGNMVISTTVNKIHKINGYLVGVAGRCSSGVAFFDWFKLMVHSIKLQEENPESLVEIPEDMKDDEFQALVISPEGSIEVYESGDVHYNYSAYYGLNYFSIGSGDTYALAAMDMGASALQAVEIAIKRDIYSGGEIFMETLDNSFDKRGS